MATLKDMDGASALDLLLFRGVPASSSQLYVSGSRGQHEERCRFKASGDDVSDDTNHDNEISSGVLMVLDHTTNKMSLFPNY